MLKLEDTAYVLNTLPKAFLVGLILEQSPQQPVEMAEKIEEHYPYLTKFTFLRKNNFRQYCTRSLIDILEVTDVYSGWKCIGTVPGYILKYPELQQYAKFILTESVELGINPENYLTNGRNSKKQSNKYTMDILLYLYEKGVEQIDRLASAIGLNYLSTFDHIQNLAKANLVDCVRFQDKEHIYSYKWVQGKKPKEVDTSLIKRKGYSGSTKHIAKVLSKRKKNYDYERLSKMTNRSLTVNWMAINTLQQQGFVDRISSRKFAHAVIKEKALEVVENILIPFIRAYEGELKLKVEPTEQHLIKAMEMYEQKIYR